MLEQESQTRIKGDISKSVTKKDHVEKTSGQAKYIADMQFTDMLYAKAVRSEKPHARIQKIELPKMKEGYETVSIDDIPGNKGLKVIKYDQPIFAEKEVRFIGEAILLIVGPDLNQVKQYAKEVKVEYEELSYVNSIDESRSFCVDYEYEHGGNVRELFEQADTRIEETFYTGHQEQAYIETQGVIALYQKEILTVYGTMQCPFYVRDALCSLSGLSTKQVQVIQSTTGGGFGGKEDYPSLMACQAATAAMKLQKPVKYILERREDMAVTTKRHPAKMVYQAALDKNKNIIAMNIDIKLDGGAYEGLSSVVLQRSLIAAIGIYKVPALKVKGKVMVTHTVPNGAYRGFGAPQSIFAMEMFMNHLAKKIGIEPLKFKKSYMAAQGDKTATNGIFHHPVCLNKMIERAEILSDYSNKYKSYQSQSTRFRKGIGMSLFFHGCGFTGSAEKDYIKSVVKLLKYEDDTIEILVSNTDMGQGLKTTFSKIVAKVMELPIEKIKIVNPDTFRVPNSGPTVASRSLMVVGKLLERAAIRLKSEFKTGEFQEIEEHYVHPDMIPWDLETFTGDAYPTYSWGLNVVEVEVDTFLGETKILGIWGIFDVGKAIDDAIVTGQMQGGMLQGIGYASSEKMEIVKGRVSQSSMTDYIIPTSMDTVPIVTDLVENLYDGGPFGAKGVGELTLIGSAPAYAQAVEQAVNSEITCIPVTPEKLIKLCRKDA